MFAFIPLVLLMSGVIGWLIEDPVQRASLLSQVTATGVGFPSVSYTVALNCAVAPTFRVSTAGLMAIESTAEPVTGGASGAFSQDEARQARTTRAARSFHEVRRGCMRL